MLAVSILLPLAAEVAIVAFFVDSSRRLEEQNKDQIRSSKSLKEAYDASRTLGDFTRSLSGYTLTREISFLDNANKFAASAQKHVQNMSGLAVSGQGAKDLKTVDRIKHIAEVLALTLSEVRLVESESDDSGQIDVIKRIYLLNDILVRDIDALIAEQQTELETLIHASANVRHLLEQLTLYACAIQIFICILILVSLNKQMSKSLDRLMNNAYCLVSNQPLTMHVSGDDEFAVLDLTMHKVSGILAATKRRERAMIDNTVDIICSLDHDNKIADVSASCMTLLGYSQSDLIGLRVMELLAGESTSFMRALRHSRELSHALQIETTMMHKSGAAVEVLWSGCFSQEDELLFCILHDVTERKKLESSKRDFVAMLTHDLRSPLTALVMRFEMLENGVYGELNKSGKDSVARARSTMTRLISMINDLLSVERMESGSVNLELRHIAFSDVCNLAIESVSALAAEANLSIEWSGSEELYCDPERIVRVIVNLLSNAIKFSPPEQTIFLRAKKIENCIEITISDTGRGIPVEQQSLIFERYKQLDRGDELVKGGSGLGLPVCKAIVEAHGGTIGVVSAPGKGSIFWFRLPLDQ